MAAILDAILDFEECQQGISGDFLSVILHIFLDLSWKNQLVTKNVHLLGLYDLILLGYCCGLIFSTLTMSLYLMIYAMKWSQNNTYDEMIIIIPLYITHQKCYRMPAVR